MNDSEHRELRVDLGDRAFCGERMLSLYWTAEGAALALWGLGHYSWLVQHAATVVEVDAATKAWQRLVLGTAVSVGEKNVQTDTIMVPEHLARYLSHEAACASRIMKMDMRNSD